MRSRWPTLVLRQRTWPAANNRCHRCRQWAKDLLQLGVCKAGNRLVALRNQPVSGGAAEVGTHQAAARRHAVRELLVRKGCGKQAASLPWRRKKSKAFGPGNAAARCKRKRDRHGRARRNVDKLGCAAADGVQQLCGHRHRRGQQDLAEVVNLGIAHPVRTAGKVRRHCANRPARQSSGAGQARWSSVQRSASEDSQPYWPPGSPCRSAEW